MKTTIKSILTITLVMGLGIMANAQKTSSAPASATVLADLTIALDATQNEIAFGTLSANTPAAVVLDANGTANANTGSVTNVAKFELGGANSDVTVSYDATVTLSNADVIPATMTMTPEVVGAETDAEQETATAVPSGSQVTLALGHYYLWVGGIIPTLVSQATGTYTGTFNIDVEYN
ncbi:uncharacterized protein DUF4402 [Algoriphagus ratkowskyi]|uniref:DUF4402 domain-containing protein n=1 Tax=Algoriphagus ratkowskyi TaxID=57028 RepID=A0A2W7R0G2_9BACT|nr:DUF4402 domain-containing protein [Algoriphagus ratkowskyi]PZX52756.1 uncharacterized protein DUF4402 [Algoriphagus ratkowskyi]TXD76297.1 DUF4402 domain-containing protein [Algoriphagus ratkowskyi]